MPNLKVIRLHACILWQFFASVQKEEKKENEQLFEGSYLRNGWYESHT